MFQLLKAAVGGIASKVGDGEPLKYSNTSLQVYEEEVLFCKNNVCVHLRKSVRNDMRPGDDEHIPGYFSLKRITKVGMIPDILLTWIPNTLLTVGQVDEGLLEESDATICNETNSLRMSASEISFTSNQEGDLNKLNIADTEAETRIKDTGSTGGADIAAESKDELNNSIPYTECSSQRSSASTSPRHEPGEGFVAQCGGIFSINFSDMKAVKLFLTDKDDTSGQLVISSLENQYKVFHFHHSGLDKLAKIFNLWEGCEKESEDNFKETLQKVYFISKNFKFGMKTETGEDMHPEDGNYLPLTLDKWMGLLNAMGQIEDINNFRKHVFFAGVNPETRPEAWKFLLYCFPIHSTSFERDRQRKEHEDAYRVIHEQRLSLTGEEYEKFWKNIQFTVDKDVVRTDRSHPFFTGQDNPNVEKMRNILLNYAIYNPEMGYTQGMSDLLSPLLSTIQDEVDTFWCFVGLMEFSLFATTPTDKSMDKSLGYLRELLRVMYPDFYIHCLMRDEELDLLFCHRWLVLCFKREFIEPEVLSIWEACWSGYQTDYFHIFVCVAMIRLYGNKCIESKMRIDEMMQYFMDMAMKFDGSAVLREARSLLYRFRKFQVIPCTLQGFLSGPGVWDGGIEPEIECVSRHRKCCLITANGSSNATENKRDLQPPSPGLEHADKEEGLLDKAEDLPDKAEDLPDKAGYVPDKAEDLPDKAEGLLDKAEDLPDKEEDLPDKAGYVPDKAEDLPDKAEDLPDKAQDLPGKEEDRNKKETTDSNEKTVEISLGAANGVTEGGEATNEDS